MKRIAIFLLCTILLFTCLTACKEVVKPTEPKSKTDILAVTNTDQLSEESQEESNSIPSEKDQEPEKQKDKVEPIIQKEEPKTEEKKPTVQKEEPKTEEKKPTVQKEEQQKPQTNDLQENKDEPNDDIIQKYPTFSNEAQLKQWLVGNNNNYYDEERDQTLSVMAQNNQLRYARPVIMHQNGYDFRGIAINNSGDWCYYLDKDDAGIDISVYVNSTGRNSVGAKWYNGEEPFTWGTDPIIANDIVYRYFIGISNGCHVFWSQFGSVHSALIDCEPEQITEIIPLLELEQVTINLNSDLVTE